MSHLLLYRISRFYDTHQLFKILQTFMTVRLFVVSVRMNEKLPKLFKSHTSHRFPGILVLRIHLSRFIYF